METTTEAAANSQGKIDAEFASVDKLMKNRKFVDFLSTKMIALMDTPKLQQQIRTASSNLLDTKQFDSKNLSTQAKSAVKSWAKEVVKSDFLGLIAGMSPYIYNGFIIIYTIILNLIFR